MNAIDPAAVGAAWLHKWSSDPPAVSPFEPCDLDGDLPRTDPHLALAAVVSVLAAVPARTDNRLFQALASGPLENILVYSGVAIVEDIDILARRDPTFRSLLNGVWWGSVATPVRNRLAKYCTAPW